MRPHGFLLRHHARLGIALAVLVGSTGTCRVARADDPPTVRIVPDVAQPDPAHPNAPVRTLLDGPLPASQPFYIQTSAVNASIVGATIDVWPSRGAECKEPKGPQHHHFAMVLSGTGDDRVVKARIPPLQVDQEFCVRLTWRSRLDPLDVPRFVAAFKRALLAKLERAAAAGPISPNTVRELMPAASVEGLRDASLRGTIAGAAIASVPIQTELEEWLKARADAVAAEANAEALEPKLKSATKEALAYAKANPLPPAWLLYRSERLLVFDVLPRDLQASDVDAIVQAMNAEKAGYSPEEAALIDAWTITLRQNAAEPDEAKRVALPRLPKPKHLLLPGMAAGVPARSTELANATGQVAVQEVAGALRNIVGNARLAATLRQGAANWQQKFDAAAKVALEYSGASQTFGTLTGARQAAEVRLMNAIGDAVRVDSRFMPDVELPPVLVSAPAGQGVTPLAGSFFTPAVGVALTFPTSGAGGRAWVFPHFGLNMYSTPVDRTIRLGDLVGAFRQRASLVLAISLKDIELPTTSAETVLLGGYPYVGLGYRVTQFLQLHAGTAVYRYHDPNPGSSVIHLGFAPGAGASVDLDVWSVAKNGISNL